MRTFGCLAYATNVHPHKSKFQERAKKCMMIGYAADSKAYKMFDLSTKEIFISKDVQFHENVFPLSASSGSNGLAVPTPIVAVSKGKPVSIDAADAEVTDLDLNLDPDSVVDETELEEVDAVSTPMISVNNSSPSLHSSPDYVPSTVSDVPVVSPTPEAQVRRSTRERQPPTWLKNYVNFVVPSSSSHTPQAFPYTKPNCFSDSYMVFLANMSQVQDPTTYAQAKGTYINQRKYILDLVQEAGPTGCKSVDVPIVKNTKLTMEVFLTVASSGSVVFNILFLVYELTFRFEL
ncbi:Retrovirus-related Pol polyprotein from transposon TNT 1-94 [Senna tora]|uniref:Retrovirus-related Pol polyprotein from transposon TNT 1-94 n=1 Tax=Senna tora TaxID=362788 RepID=A0A834W4N5_9FABA|nr:Retrovirus-related Pol polyprotein from transposon TNT 1-94 [Senna tora]